ncbi:MAG TPA: hypothetical protein VF261_00370 [Candidatus Saccharimonadales bacterium]
MQTITVEGGFFVERPEHLPDSLCWTAREILGAYMDEGSPLDLDDTPPDDTPGQPDDAEDNGDCDGDEDNEIDLIIHETPPLCINETECASLSNLPWIKGPGGFLVPYTEPGHVALRIDDIGDHPGIELCLGKHARQFVFRVPNGATEDDAAVFEGWSLEPAAAIPATEVKALKQLAFLLRCMRQGYRDLMEENDEALSETYLSTVPRLSTASIIDKELSGLN